MDLYDMMKNISGNNIELELGKAIAAIREKYHNLTEEKHVRFIVVYYLMSL